MHDRPLHDRRILVVEDEYLLADELQRELEEAGAIVIGPVATLQAAFVAVDVETGIDGAVLDVNLGGDWIFHLQICSSNDPYPWYLQPATTPPSFPAASAL